MKKTITNALLSLLIVSTPGMAVENDGYLEESRKIAQEFMQRLGGSLKSQLESGGVGSAISVCKHVAPALAAEVSKDGLVVTRVSLKARNKILGTPDAWERGNLEKFDREQREGNITANPEATEVIEEGDGRWFRYMKAIPTQPMCQQCHGEASEIPADVKAVLAKEYPEDQATGYQVGDIRGAISIKRKLADMDR